MSVVPACQYIAIIASSISTEPSSVLPEELEAGVDAPFTAPDAYDERHRDEAALEKQVEERQVERTEDAKHQRFDPRLAGDRESAASTVSVEMQAAADVVDEAPRETARAILSAAAELSLPLRQALLLRDLQGLSYEEIARAQGVPVGTVRSRLSAARAAVVKRVSE